MSTTTAAQNTLNNFLEASGCSPAGPSPWLLDYLDWALYLGEGFSGLSYICTNLTFHHFVKLISCARNTLFFFWPKQVLCHPKTCSMKLQWPDSGYKWWGEWRVAQPWNNLSKWTAVIFVSSIHELLLVTYYFQAGRMSHRSMFM